MNTNIKIVRTSPSISDHPENQPLKMTLKWFNGTKGFGFVVPEDNSFDAFLHITTLQEAGVHNIGEGAELICTLQKGQKGMQVKTIEKVCSQGSFSTIPQENKQDGTITMGGLVKWFKPEKGFGFVIPDDGQKDVFIHQSLLELHDIEELRAGQRVQITVRDVEKGREATRISVDRNAS